GMTDCGRVPDPLAKKQSIPFRSSFPTARGHAGNPEKANVIPAEAGIQPRVAGCSFRGHLDTPSAGRSADATR
ncbi:MAG TPA: hypothetical protein PK251_11865, partial [Candidatus Latescibacteria bacterium]|nr:hypothetical protein [Candidatus Latescibacterota bacterium]HPK75528.1 hypothetical protein [Candidatus Latescibacterota bacterium]